MKVGAEDILIRSLLTRGKYTIPDYQREYDWENEQIDELIDDIEECSQDDNYFIGHMVFEGKRNGNQFKVIDGQQRITTLTIILCCLRDIFYSRDENDLGDAINDKYIFARDDDNNKYAILENEASYPVLQSRVQNIPNDKDSNVFPQKDGEKKIMAAYNKLYESFVSRSTEELKLFREKILNLETVFVVAEGVSNAATIFMTLNATGKNLTPIELVKSIIFSSYPSKPLIKEPNETWKRILANIHLQSKFLNNFFASRYKKVSDAKLFNEVEKTIKTLNPDKGQATKEFLSQMDKDSEIFKYINNPSPGQWKKNEYPIYESINAIIKIINIRVSTPFLMALLRDYKKGTVSFNVCKSILNTMEQFHFINNAICSKRSSGMDKLYAKYAHELYIENNKNNKHRVIRELITELISKKASLEDFKNNIDTKLYYKKSNDKQKELVKYVLYKLERHRNKNAVPINVSIEHIYPESPQEMMLSDSNLIQNIGNLVLLEEKVNSQIGNKPFLKKKSYILANSKMFTSIEVFKNHTEWCDEQILQRKETLVDEMYNKMWT